jgi:hypothetical protein
VLSGIDTSYIQGNFTPSGVNFTIINASRANNGGLGVGSYYHAQVDNARSAGVEIGHYFFNGDGDGTATATQCADFFVDNLYGYRTGDALVLDVEYEESSGTVAWNPSQVLAFAQRVFERTGVKIGVYLNLSLIRGSDWSAVVAFGCWLWVAWPGDESEIVTGAWPDWTMWQYTIVDNLDRNYSKAPLAQLSGGSTSQPLDEDMSYSLVPNALDSTIWVCSLVSGNYVGIANPYHMTLLQRYKANQGGDKMLSAELDIVRGYLRAINPTPTIDQAAISTAISSALKSANVSVDPASIETAVSAGVKQAIASHDAELTKLISDDAAQLAS